MTPAPDLSVLGSTRALCAALEALATALASGDPAAVLAVEGRLAAAVEASVKSTGTIDDPAALDVEVRRAHALLAQCRASGTAAALLLDTTLDMLGRDGAYDRHGGRAGTPALRRHDVRARV